MKDRIQISIIVSAYNESESLPFLVEEIYQAMTVRDDASFEILYMDDGSTDDTREILEKLKFRYAQLSAIGFSENIGRSAILQCGFDHARGDILITVDGDLQDDPAEIPRLMDKLNQGYDLVSGYKKQRKDPWLKIISSRIFNWIVRTIFKIPVHDFNSGFKIYRKKVIEKLNLQGGMYRFIPVLVSWQGFKIAEIEVRHRPRKYGKSKFGLERFWPSLVDLFRVYAMTRSAFSPFSTSRKSIKDSIAYQI